MNKSAMRFLDKLFKDLYKEKRVLRYGNQKFSSIDKYMQKLERVTKGTEKGHSHKDYIIKLLTDYYVIKEENIPYNIDKAQVISGQRDSLSVWINYLIDDTCSYPMWIKYWVFRSLIKIGTYDEVSNTWQKRNEKTLSPFIDFNAEALASTVSAIMKSVNKEINDEADINDEEVEKLVQTGNFKKLYTRFLVKVSKQAKKYGNEGSWIKYNQGTDDYIKLSNSLQGYNTGWCTANEEMAKKQICGSYSDAPNGGDFYVYYSVDENGEHKIPRIAIRMSGSDKIGEIRGVATGQNLEEGLEDILETKLKEMSLWTEDVIEKVNANKLISKIIKKHLSHQILETDEIKVIYELTKLPGFGYEIDPRLEKIRKKRNAQIDFDKLDEQTQILWLGLGNFKIICENKKLIMEAVKQYRDALRYASEELKNNREFILEAVKQNGNALKYSSEELRSDREIVLEAVKKNGNALEYASEELKADREVVLEAVKKYGGALEYASEELKADREVVLEAVKQNGYALVCASEELRADREIVLEAVKQNGLAMKYASEELRGDREIVLEAVKQNFFCLEYASEELRADRKFMLEAVKEYGRTLQFASEELKSDREIVLEAVKQNGDAMKYASEELRADREFMLEAVKENYFTLNYASEELKNDRKFMLEALKQNGDVLEYASEKIRKDKIFLLNLKLYELTNFIKVKFTYISDKFINGCKKFILKKENINEQEQQNRKHL